MPAGSWVWLVTGRASGATVGPFTHLALNGVMGRRRTIIGVVVDPPTSPTGRIHALRWSEPVYPLGWSEPRIRLGWSEPVHELRSTR